MFNDVLTGDGSVLREGGLHSGEWRGRSQHHHLCGGGDTPSRPSSTPKRRSRNTPSQTANTSPWPSPYPQGSWASPLPGGVSPSPARGSTTPGRNFFRRPFPSPSPAKHITSFLAKRLGNKKPSPIPEDGGGGEQQSLDKSFGYGKNFGAKYELGKEVERGHFGHTCSARRKKGDLKDQPLAVKIISKAKVKGLTL